MGKSSVILFSCKWGNARSVYHYVVLGARRVGLWCTHNSIPTLFGVESRPHSPRPFTLCASYIGLSMRGGRGGRVWARSGISTLAFVCARDLAPGRVLNLAAY